MKDWNNARPISHHRRAGNLIGTIILTTDTARHLIVGGDANHLDAILLPEGVDRWDPKRIIRLDNSSAVFLMEGAEEQWFRLTNRTRFEFLLQDAPHYAVAIRQILDKRASVTMPVIELVSIWRNMAVGLVVRHDIAQSSKIVDVHTTSVHAVPVGTTDFVGEASPGFTIPSSTEIVLVDEDNIAN